MTDETTTDDFPELMPWPTYYSGRKWDAPLTDDATEMSPEFAATMLDGTTMGTWCGEPLLFGEDILLTPAIQDHIECHLRPIMGDVQHLEKRCMCSRGSGNEITYDSDHYTTHRESAKAALQWLIDHNQGRFHP